MSHRILGPANIPMCSHPDDPHHNDPSQARSSPSRRLFLKSLAVAGASTLFPAGTLIGEAAQSASAGAGRIDVHHHMIPPFYVKAMGADRSASSATAEWSPSVSLDLMDHNGVSTAMLSVTQGVAGDSLSDRSERARSLAHQNNEYGAQVVKDNPKRFGLFASLPLPDQDGSLREIEHSLDTLKADGIALWNVYGEKWAGDPAFAAVFDELNRRGAVVFFHPMRSSCCDFPGQTSALDFDVETAQNIYSFLASGTFSRCPNIKFIFSHAGGAITVLYPRIIDAQERLKDKIPHGVEYELKRLYFDTAKANTPSILDALKDMVPVSQILYGSDAPVQKYSLTNPGFAAYTGFSPADRKAIDRGNAERLFPRLKA